MTRVLISIPEKLLEHLDAQAEKEYRTRSEMIRECFRVYLKTTEHKALVGEVMEEEVNAQEANEDE